MINVIPFFGWLISIGINASLAVPFWFFWTWCGLGAKYFAFLPEAYWSIPFLNCIGLFVIFSVLKAVLVPSLPFSIKHKKENK